MNIESISLIVTVTLAFLGYLVTYLNNIQITKRNDQRDLINKRIAEFYGPLYVATQTSNRAYAAMLVKLKRQQKGLVDHQHPTLTDEEMTEWCIWLESVFMPVNLLIEKLITEKAYLIQEEEMPACLLEFITHVSAYKAGLFDKSNINLDVDSIIDFPKGLDVYAMKSYKELKAKQLKLVGGK
jgi:hypothetical protein